MKRRKFLSLIGAATTAPLMPMPGLAATAPASASYSAAAMHGAMLHARSSSHISTFRLSQLLEVSVPQANALMTDMASKGVIAPLNGVRANSRWAASRIHRPAFAKLSRRAQPKASNPAQQPRPQHRPQRHDAQPNIDLMLAHLRDISTRYFAANAA